MRFVFSGSGYGHTTYTLPQTVTSPASLGDGNFNVVNSQANASITVGNGNSTILETAAGATVTAGNGNDRITDLAGSASVTVGTGDQRILLGGTGNKVVVAGNAGGAFELTEINAGQGNDAVTGGAGNYAVAASGGGNTISLGAGLGAVTVSGVGNTVTTGSGTHVIATHDSSSLITADTINLGGGTNLVFLGGSGNTVNDGGGNDMIIGSRVGNDTFVTNATGGTETIAGFTLTDGDKLDLSALLAGTGALADGSNLSSFVTLAQQPDARHPSTTDTVLTVKGTAASASITLLNTGTLNLTDLVTNGSIVPAHA